MIVRDMIKQNLIVVEEEYEDYTSYTVSDKNVIKYNDELVLNVDVNSNGSVWVITMQGREHIGEYGFEDVDDIPVEIFTK